MKAIVITSTGEPDVLQVRDWPDPKPGEGEVLIKVFAFGINRPDVMQRKGQYPPPPGASDIPGLEIAGVIVALGEGCFRWKIGERVCALVTGGGYAEYCVAPEGQCLPVPDVLSYPEAASLPETFFTVWTNVFDRGQLKPGESLLVHGGSSGIGVAAIQLAKAWGAVVYTTAGNEEKCSFCEKMGADKAVHYGMERFKDVITKLTMGKGVNVVLDMIGGTYTQDNLDILSDEGRLVLINFMKGDEVKIKLSSIMRKRLTITGSTLRNRDAAFKKEIAHKLEEYVWPWLTSGKVKPTVYKTFHFHEAADAHRLMESSKHMGKIVVLVDQHLI
jgi:NADPH:quinone reductase